ncbi:hypothetical protein [Dactylosporangium sp. NPDC049140]|uniref:hypothetical protein n=1 Tax=Dactylosporangium sp. NPDC049140 TaxID=3155647 RepID=UPI00340B927D
MDFALFSGYEQIELYDVASGALLADHWAPDDANPLGDLFALTDDAVAIWTGVNDHVVVTVEVLPAPAPLDVDAFAIVAECSLRSPSGRLRLTCPTYGEHDGDRFDVPAGGLRLRVSLTHELLTAQSRTGSPFPLRLQLWPAPPKPPVVVKDFGVPAHAEPMDGTPRPQEQPGSAPRAGRPCSAGIDPEPAGRSGSAPSAAALNVASSPRPTRSDPPATPSESG